MNFERSAWKPAKMNTHFTNCSHRTDMKAGETNDFWRLGLGNPHWLQIQMNWSFFDNHMKEIWPATWEKFETNPHFTNCSHWTAREAYDSWHFSLGNPKSFWEIHIDLKFCDMNGSREMRAMDTQQCIIGVENDWNEVPTNVQKRKEFKNPFSFFRFCTRFENRSHLQFPRKNLRWSDCKSGTLGDS